MRSLSEFWGDHETSENVKNYLIETLKEIAVERVFNKESVEGIADAKEAIETAFTKMDIMFEKKVESKITNEAR